MVIEQLLVQRAIPEIIRPYRRQETRTRELLQLGQIDPAAAVFEPLYLLLTFGALTSTPVEPGASDHETEEISRIDAVGRCLGALRNELTAVSAALTALAELLAQADQAPGSAQSREAAHPR